MRSTSSQTKSKLKQFMMQWHILNNHLCSPLGPWWWCPGITICYWFLCWHKWHDSANCDQPTYFILREIQRKQQMKTIIAHDVPCSAEREKKNEESNAREKKKIKRMRIFCKKLMCWQEERTAPVCQVLGSFRITRIHMSSITNPWSFSCVYHTISSSITI